jgi:hypothetical protein
LDSGEVQKKTASVDKIIPKAYLANFCIRMVAEIDEQQASR